MAPPMLPPAPGEAHPRGAGALKILQPYSVRPLTQIERTAAAAAHGLPTWEWAA